MSLYKRSGSPYWWVKLSYNGGRLQESTGTAIKKQAQEYHDKRRAELWEQERLGIKPRYLWDEAVLRYLDEMSHKATAKDDKMILRWWQKHFEGSELASIKRDAIDRLTKVARAEGVSDGTVNRRLAVLRALLRKASNDWEWLDRIPKVRMLPAGKGRTRFLSPLEAQRLLQELPEHLRSMTAFALCTGLRQGNIKRLKWSQVDINRSTAWIHAHEAKSRRAIAVPLTPDAVRILQMEQGKHPQFVFTYQGEPINQVGTKAWRGALKRAGIEDFRFHDLRHTWASWHIQSGTTLNELQALGAWASLDMVLRYAHLSSAHLARSASRFAESFPLQQMGAGYILATEERMH